MTGDSTGITGVVGTGETDEAGKAPPAAGGRKRGRQLSLPVNFPAHRTFDNYLPSAENEVAVRHLRSLGGETPEHARQVFLWGARGVGKTHLLQAVCHDAAMRGERAVWLPVEQAMAQGGDAVKGFETMPVVCLDGIDAIGIDSEWQFALFRLINGIRANRGLLLMSGSRAPQRMDFLMRDLSSRVLWGTVYHIRPLSDDDLGQAMRLYAQSRHISLSEQVTRYLIGSFPRDLKTMTGWIDRLCEVARADRRNITVPLIKELSETSASGV